VPKWSERADGGVLSRFHRLNAKILLAFSPALLGNELLSQTGGIDG
jgi:hypothetical protein